MHAKEEKRKNLFNFRPVLFSAVFLALGIYFYFQSYFNGVSVRWLIFVLPLAVAPFFFCRKGKSFYYTFLSVVLLIVSFFVGYFRFSNQLDAFTETDGVGGSSVVGTVVEKREYSYASGFVLSDIKIDGKGYDGKLIAYLPASFSNSLGLCDEILLSGEVKAYELKTEDFSLQAADFGEDIRYRVNAKSATVIGYRFQSLLFLRSRAEAVIDAGMDADSAGVTKAILFGEKDGIEASLYENIRYGGIAHIFAVSGLHIGALFAFCLFLIKKSPLHGANALLRWLAVSIVLFLYAGLCGFSPSVVRAFILCSLSYGANCLRVKKDRLELLALAAVVILLFTPSALFEVGFQLSFSACFGIVLLAKPIGQVCVEFKNLFIPKAPKKKLSLEEILLAQDKKRVWDKVMGFLSVSLAAQIATAPIQLYYFGYLSGWALALNCLFVPAIGVLFPLLLGLVAVACLLPITLAPVVLYLPNLLWNIGLLLFYAFDFSSLALYQTIGVGAVGGYASACVFSSDKLNVSRFTRVLFAVAFFCVFVIRCLL